MADLTPDLLEEIAPYTKSSKERLMAMGESVVLLDTNKIEGDIVECGVWAGGNIILARQLAPRRICWLYDTFAGMTRPGKYDVKKNGVTALERYAARNGKWADVSLSEVKRNLSAFSLLDDNKLRFVEGPVEETLLNANNLPDKIALLRLDTDWYASTKIELEILFPRVVPGGILIVDDYGHWLGARKAVDDYFGHRKWAQIDYTAIMTVK